MYSILIAEDDDLIRQGLRKIVSNMDLPLNTIYEASNGQEALEICINYCPEIVLTDIKMPLMSGLDFIEKLYKSNMKSKFIIISGYSEFSFAQQAISLNVVDYILKPIRKDKLYNTLLKTIDRLNLEVQENRKKIDVENNLKAYKFLILKEILKGKYNSKSINDILQKSDIKFSYKGFLVLSLIGFSNLDIANNFISKYLNSIHICSYFFNDYNHITFLINLDYDTLSDFNNGLFALLNHQTTMHIGISEYINNVELLPASLHQAETALDFRLINRNENIYFYEKIKNTKPLSIPCEVHCEEVLNSIISKKKALIFNSIDNFINMLFMHNSITPSLIKRSIDTLMLNYIIPNTNYISREAYSIEELYQSSESILDFKLKLKELIGKAVFQTSDQADDNYTNKIKTVIKYIHDNYSKELTLDNVSSYISISPSYFSNIFKKETGMRFTDYLQKVRVEKSKKLLRDPRYKVYEIADKVGFVDEKYYYKVFRKYTGMTPNNYRNQV